MIFGSAFTGLMGNLACFHWTQTSWSMKQCYDITKQQHSLKIQPKPQNMMHFFSCDLKTLFPMFSQSLSQKCIEKCWKYLFSIEFSNMLFKFKMCQNLLGNISVHMEIFLKGFMFLSVKFVSNLLRNISVHRIFDFHRNLKYVFL